MKLPVLSLAAACVLAAVPALAQQAQAPKGTLTQRQLAPVRDVLAAAQQRLQQLGYHTSPTGQWNADTANAVQLFQSDHGLRPTGEVDLQTIAALGLDVNAAGRSTAMLAEPGQQYAMLPESEEQIAAARFQNSPAYNLPIFTGGDTTPNQVQTREQGGPFTVLGVPQTLTVSPTGRTPGVSPAAPMEDLVR